MNDLFKCKNCGAPRSYIHQYCPICESSGPHIPAVSSTSRSLPVKRKVDRDTPWWNDIELNEKKKPKKRQKKEWDFVKTVDDSRSEFISSSEDAEEKPKKTLNSNTPATLVFTIALILVLLVGTLYVITNFEDVTKWLTSPTMPEFIRHSGAND
ncbi:MAG: hypothetical protein NTZ34_05630 [Chloroflexi bacterium]|nr:hypothetical protein [Chloroflexota bacterium]